MDTTETFADLDIDKLALLLSLLKDAEVPYFRHASLEISFSQPEPDKAVDGFVPHQQHAIAQAQRAAGDDDAPDQYRKVFKGAPPSFHKPRGE